MNKLPAFLLALVLAGAPAAPAQASPARPAPPIALEAGGTLQSLQSLRGQPVVVLVARNPRSRAFRKQVKRFEEAYQGFAARKTVFVAAFTESSEGLRSSIPFVLARDGAAVAAAYGVEGRFALLVIGGDGNLDLKTERVSGAYRAMDAILNNFALQTAERRP